MTQRLLSSELAAAILNRRMLICVLIGFSSGMPLFVVQQMIPLWLRDQGVGLAEIGLFSLLGLPYVLKFLWAPLVDRYQWASFGRRKSWMLATQLLLLLGIAAIGSFSPQQQLLAVAVATFLLAIFSATQDIAIDAYRRELLPDRELGLGNAIHVNAYRISGLVPGSLGFVLADHLPWPTVFAIVAAFMAVGILASLRVSEPALSEGRPRSLQEAVIEPFMEFWQRAGGRQALLLLLFVFFYKFGDSMATALSTPFYYDLGFSKTQIGLVVKNVSLWSSIVGGIFGGVLMIRLGINRALWLFGVVQMLSILGFVWLAEVGDDLRVLIAVVGFEYLGVGLGTAAFVAFISRATSRRFAATQFALLSAVAAIPRTFIAASAGFIVEALGWTGFFLLCAVLALPGMLLLLSVAPWREQAGS